MSVIIIPNKNAATHTQYGVEANSTRQWEVFSEFGAVRSIEGGCEGNWSIEVDVDEEESCIYTVELEEKAAIQNGVKVTVGFQSRIRTKDQITLNVYINDPEGQKVVGPIFLKRKCNAYKGDVVLDAPMKKICFAFGPGNPESLPIIDGLWLGFGDSPSGGGGGADEDSRPKGSIQDKINNALVNDEIPVSTITIQDMSGDVYVPPGVNIAFFNCILGTIEFGGNNTFQIHGGLIGTIYIGVGSQFWMDGQATIDIFEAWGSSGTVKNTTFTTSINIREQSDIEMIDTIHISPKIMDVGCSRVFMLRPQATVPETGIYAKSANLILSYAHFEQKHGYVVSVEDHSYLQISDSHIEGYFDCPAVTVAGNSTGIITQTANPIEPDPGLFSGVWALKAVSGSYVRVKDSHIVGSPGNWSDYGIWADDHSVVEATGDGVVRIEGGDFPGVRASKGSSVTVTNYFHIWAATREAIYCDEDSKVRVFGLTDKIQAEVVDAIWIRDHSRVEVYDVPLIFAVDGDAVDMSEYCDFIGVNISNKMEGVKDYGIKCTVHSNAKIDRVVSCIGDGEDGVYLFDNSRLIASNGEIIMGKADHGIEAKDNCQIVVKDYTDEIVGLGPDGIHMEDNCRASLLRINRIRGVGRDGIHMEDTCHCHTRYCKEIIGEGRDGIFMDTDCRHISISDEDIEGEGRDGVHGENECEFTSMRGDIIVGRARDGIYMDNGKLINVQRTHEVRGIGRDGIHASKCEIDVHHVDVLHGDGDKCIYVDDCVGTFETIPDGYGASYGLYEINNSDIRVFRSIIAGANPLSLYMNNSSRVFAKDVEFAIKDAKTQEHCETYLENVIIYGKFESKIDCKHEWLRVKIMDKIDFDEAIYRWKEVEILGNHECKKCTGKAENVEVLGNFEDEDSENHFSDYRLTGLIDHTNCTTKLKGSTITNLIGLSNCTLIGENTTVSQITDFTGSMVTYSACDVADIDGKGGSSYKQFATSSATIKLEDSAGEMEGGDTGTVTLDTSSFTIKSGDAGDVTITKGSLEQYGGEVGAVDVTDGGFTHQGGESGAVSIKNGGLIQQGGKLGAVDLTSAAFSGKGGECGAVSVGSSSLELMSTNAGGITGVHKPLPGCVPGQVVRVGTDKLYEVFDQNVKRWFDQHLEERITLDKKVNVKGDSYHRVDGDHQMDIGGDSSWVAEGLLDMQSGDDMELLTGGDLSVHVDSSAEIITGNDMDIDVGFNFNSKAGNDSIHKAMVNFELHCTAIMQLLAGLNQIRSATTVVDNTPSYSQVNSVVPPIPIPPDSPDSPDSPDGTEEPSP